MIADLIVGAATLLLIAIPGWAAARRYQLPAPAVAGLIGGAVALLLLVQILDTAGIPLTRSALFPAWMVLSAGALFVFRPQPGHPPGGHPVDPHKLLLLLPVIPALGVVLYRAVAQPLFGVDTVFRWNYLAEQMLAQHTLSFYPPVTASDYALYAWPDGIAPVVSCLYFFSYLLVDAARPVLTAPVVVAEFALVLVATHALALKHGSPRSAAIACALVAGSPLVLWGTAMGQESGVMCLSLLGLLLYLPNDRTSASVAGPVFAGLAAGLGGLAREYGLAFFLFGFGLAIARRLSGRAVASFALAGLLAVLPWYVRNWTHTGNPLFNLNVGGLFPVNQAHLNLMTTYQENFGWSQLPPEATRILLTNAVVGFAAIGLGLIGRPARGSSLVMAAGLAAGLWAISLGFTAAGFTYSLRVLTPALVMLAILGGVVIARWIPARSNVIGLFLALLLLAGDASLRALALPVNVYRLPAEAWLQVGGAIQDYHHRPVYQQIARQVGNAGLLVLGPTALVARQGARVIPLWSPEVDFLWGEKLSIDEAGKQLVEQNIRYVLLNHGAVNTAYLRPSRFFSTAAGSWLIPIWADEDMTLYRIRSPGPAAGESSSAP